MSTKSDEKLDPKRFTAFKKSTSDHAQYGAVQGLTFREAHDNFPFGRQFDKDGTYIWSVCLTECYKGNSK